MIKIAICDDDKMDRAVIERLCNEYYENGLKVFHFSSGEELLKSLGETKFSIIFLDIKMQEINGIEIKNYMQKNRISGNIIFISGYKQYLIDSFGKNVFGFIEKPINKDDLFSKLDDIFIYETIYKEIELEDVMGKIMRVNTENIVYISAERVYTNVKINTGESIIIRKSLNEWEMELNMDFFARAHRSNIVNLKYLDRIDSAVRMKDGTKLPVSREKIKSLRETYDRYLIGTARVI